MTIDKKVEKMDEELKEKWLPIFREGYGNDATIEEIECIKAGINGSTYRVLVKTTEGKNEEHYVRLLLGSNDPVMIDEMVTPAGQNYIDFWSEYGKAIGDAYK